MDCSSVFPSKKSSIETTGKVFPSSSVWVTLITSRRRASWSISHAPHSKSFPAPIKREREAVRRALVASPQSKRLPFKELRLAALILRPLSYGLLLPAPFALHPQALPAIYRPSHTRILASEPSGGPNWWLLAGARLSGSRVRGGTNRRLPSGASRLFDAPATRGWRSFRPSIPSLEPEDEGLHLRRPQQHPHHRPRPDRADAASRACGRERYRFQGRAHPVRRHQAAGPGRG